MNTKPKIHQVLYAFLITGILVFALMPVHAQELTEEAVKSQTNLRRFVPTTVSEGWQDVYAKLPDPTQMATLPGPDDIESWIDKSWRPSEITKVNN
jgi:hypothetical protein